MQLHTLFDAMSLRVRGREVVGVVPAAGQSRRLGHLPCSKEVFPVGFVGEVNAATSRPKVAAEYLLERMKAGGVAKAYIVIRDGKWDIPAYFGDGREVGIELAYVVISGSAGPPDSVDRLNSFVKEQIVAFGFPDIMLEPSDIFRQLLGRLESGRSEIVLGLFPAGQDCQSRDMIEYDSNGRVVEVILKPDSTHLEYGWACAVWTPTFTEFLHRFMRSEEMKNEVGFGGGRQIDAQGDLPVGAVIRAAVQHGIPMECVPFSNGTYIDIGTLNDLQKASRIHR